jgi:hypothetical protein
MGVAGQDEVIHIFVSQTAKSMVLGENYRLKKEFSIW